MIPPPARFVSSLTKSVLRDHLATNSLPLHVGQSLTAAWAARKTWRLDDDLARIRSVGEDKEVEVEVGRPWRGYLDPDFQRIDMGLGLFLDAFVLGKIPSADPSSLPTAYLAQSDLLDHHELVSDVPALDVYEAGPQGTMYRRTMWIGPGCSFTPFHRDPYIGLYSQILGSKTFFVLPPSASSSLHPSTDPRHANTSTIPAPVSSLFPPPGAGDKMTDLRPELIEWSKKNLEAAFKLSGAASVTLKPGESVLVPEGWWHSAEGAEGSGIGIGVGAWFR